MPDDYYTFERLLDEAALLIARAESLHTPRFDFGTGVPLYRSEIHTIQTIGKNPGINVTRLAEKMGVTKGAVSQTLGKLVRKGLIEKRTARTNEKEVIPELTESGRLAYENHELFHRQMYTALKDHYGDGLSGKIERFRETVGDLLSILTLFEGRMKMR